MTKNWWDGNKRDTAGLVYGAAEKLRRDQRPWRLGVRKLMQLRIGSQDITGQELGTGADDGLRFNLISAAADTASSLIASARPLPLISTKGGDYSLQRKAKLRSRILQTQAVELNLYTEHAPRAFDDALIAGIGWIHAFQDPETGLPSLERVMPLEMTWDWTESTNGCLRSLYRWRVLHKDTLKQLYPSQSDKIADSCGPKTEELSDYDIRGYSAEDLVSVIEAWHTPATYGGKGGRHVIATDKALLVDQEWKRTRFPFGKFRWAPRPIGMLGRSLCDELRPAQRRIHEMIQRIEKSGRLGSVPRVLIYGNAGLEAEEINNLEMQVIRVTQGDQNSVEFKTFDATPHDLQQEIDRIIDQIWLQLGLNSQQTNGEKPTGVESGVALRAIDDIGSRRHAQNLKYFEQSCLDVFEALSDTNDDCADNDPAFELHSDIRGRFLETSRWSELTIKPGDARLSVFPVSSLPTTPGGRFDRIQDLINQGWVSRATAIQLLGFPDNEAYEDLETADMRLAQRQVADILDGKTGMNVMPEKYQDIAVAADYARKSYVMAREEGAPDGVCATLRTYLEACERLAQAAAPPPEAAPEMAGMLPPEAAGLPSSPNQQPPEAL